MGISGRAAIHADYLWFFLTLLAICLAIFQRNRSLRDEIDELKWRLDEAEKLVSRSVILVEQPVESAPRAPDSQRQENVKSRASNLPLFTGTKDTTSTPNRRRKVRITKLSGLGMRESHTAIVGFEEHPPEEGKEYRFFSEQGTLFQTSPVVQVSLRYFRTQDATYEIEVLEED